MTFQLINELEQTQLITYKKTALGWFNITVDGKRYNVNPELFRDITNISNKTVAGAAELSESELHALIDGGIAI